MARKTGRTMWWIGGVSLAAFAGWWWWRRREVVAQIGPRNVWRVIAIDIDPQGVAAITTDRTFEPLHERDTQPSREAAQLAQELVPTSVLVAVIEQGQLRMVWGEGHQQPSQNWPDIASELAKLDIHAEAPQRMAA